MGGGDRRGDDRRRAAGRGEPAGALVLVHGRGADEQQLLWLLDALDPERASTATARAARFGFPGGAHWYALPRVGYPDPATFAEGFAALAASSTRSPTSASSSAASRRAR